MDRLFKSKTNISSVVGNLYVHPLPKPSSYYSDYIVIS